MRITESGANEDGGDGMDDSAGVSFIECFESLEICDCTDHFT